MSREFSGGFEREERRNQVLLDYVEALEAGREPDRAQFMAEHPDLRPDLEAFLAGHDEVARLTAPLRAARKAPPVRPAACRAMCQTISPTASASSAISVSCVR